MSSLQIYKKYSHLLKVNTFSAGIGSRNDVHLTRIRTASAVGNERSNYLEQRMPFHQAMFLIKHHLIAHDYHVFKN